MSAIKPLAMPPADTPAGSLHWLHRPTGAPHWMVATWTGDGWHLMDGKRPSPPDHLPWWQYAAPATPPAEPGSPYLRPPCRSATETALEIAVAALTQLREWNNNIAAEEEENCPGSSRFGRAANHRALCDGALARIAALRGDKP